MSRDVAKEIVKLAESLRYRDSRVYADVIFSCPSTGLKSRSETVICKSRSKVVIEISDRQEYVLDIEPHLPFPTQVVSEIWLSVIREMAFKFAGVAEDHRRTALGVYVLCSARPQGRAALLNVLETSYRDLVSANFREASGLVATLTSASDPCLRLSS